MVTDQYLYFVYGGFFILTVGFSLLINKLFLNFVRTLGIRNRSDTIIRWSAESKPALGGFSFYIIFLFSIVCYSIFFDTGKVFLNKEFIGILLATMLAFLLGLTDDSYDTRPLLKVSAQITCGIILLVTGSKIVISSFEPLNYFITVFWVVGIMNALNMLDNMDGITSTVSIFILLSCMAVIVLHRDFENVFFITMIGVCGATCGFLYYNWSPSKMFMGDTGSQFLGVFLAAMGIRYLWNADTETTSLLNARNIILPVIVFIMPIIDTTTVVINRLRKRQSPFIGGRDHTTHALVYAGFSERKVAIIFGLLCFSSLILAIVIEKFLHPWNHIYTLVFSLWALMMFFAFYFLSRKNIT